MTNVSAVEKMAELMQQMEENSPRVAAFQYCLKQVAEKVEEAEKRNAELEARCAALAAENAGLKDEISNITFMRDDDFFGSTQRAQEVMGRLVNVKTPATDAFLAEVRAQGVEMFAAVLRRKGDDAFFDAIAEAQANAADQFAAQLRKGVQS
ncbi:TPA: hypothetical protein LTW63_004705 [Enterobacter hormaechei]|nr:hypothetical protein [Enterobacter hormaechei]HBL8874956.1 hypothetical protein [Enterobacter hormaechei]HBL8902680.1 hypothetical protein [Enterobacter hormaechei]HBL8915712.1 hypothetical protein [Enterobacter hormaechei]HBL8943078.1 hypothetical protein [Enterobacter hormaechei]